MKKLVPQVSTILDAKSKIPIAHRKKMNIVNLVMQYRLYFLLCTAILLFSACSSTPGYENHRGYLTRPYTIKGKHYKPMSVKQALSYQAIGIASHYNETSFWGLSSGQTSIGEDVHPWHLHAAHKTLPLPCRVRVTSLRNGKSVIVRVNDRGPFVNNRLIDLSQEAAERLDMVDKGLDKVHIQVLSVGDGKYRKYAKHHHTKPKPKR